MLSISYFYYLFNFFSGQGHSLLQGMSTPKFKKHEPSGEPAGFSTVGTGKSKVFHSLNVAFCDPEYLDKFGVFIDNLIGCVNQTGARVVFIPPFLRSPIACCIVYTIGSFCTEYMTVTFLTRRL